MKVSALKYTTLSWSSNICMLIILLMPFHALLTVWGASLIGHYTALRLWKEVLLVVCVIGALYLLLTDHKIRYHTLSRRLVWLILAYIGLNFVWALLAYVQHDVTAEAVGYGLIVNLRFLVFFLVTWALTVRTSRMRRNWQWIVLWPAGAVVVLGLLQVFVLPNDILAHFGYKDATIPAIETVNSNIDYIRATSTLRGANPLGAYLIIPIALTTLLLIRKGRNWRQALLLAGSLLLLIFTYSRSAWIGAALTIGILLFVSLRSHQARLRALIGAVVLVVLLGLVSLAFHESSRWENLVFHTQSTSNVKVSSIDSHLEALRLGINDVRHEPLGAGVGTAGPASAHNGDKPANIAENYFVQIAQELGIIGLGLFALINIGVGYLLWIRRDDTLALSLFASLIGLTLVNLLSHAWTDDTLAYVWWGLAGIAMAPFIEDANSPAPQPETSSKTQAQITPKPKTKAKPKKHAKKT